jgi:Na+/melibiose symporter-like transporter
MLVGFAYSVVNIRYGPLAAEMTQIPDERAKLASVRVLATNLAILILVFVVSPTWSSASHGRPMLHTSTCPAGAALTSTAPHLIG